MRNSTLGAKALSIMPPATITPLKMVTGRAPKFSTQTLQMGPGREKGRRENGVKSEKGVENTSGAEGQRRCCAADPVSHLDGTPPPPISVKLATRQRPAAVSRRPS